MGEETPGRYPQFDPVKWYCLYTTEWALVGLGCGGVFSRNWKCCYDGNTIKIIIDSGGFCATNCAICAAPCPGWESLDGYTGPYDDQAACLAAC